MMLAAPVSASRGLVISLVLSTIALALGAMAVQAPPAAATPTGSSGSAVTLVSDGIREPAALRTAPDGCRGSALTLDAAQIVEHNNSAGLLSIAFPPDFTTAAVSTSTCCTPTSRWLGMPTVTTS